MIGPRVARFSARQPTVLGRPLVIGIILLHKAIMVVVLVVLAAVLFGLRRRGITEPFQHLFAGELLEDPHDILANLLIHLLPSISLRTEGLLAIGALLYAALEAVEFWGIWCDVYWVEILIVVETAAFLPRDVWELAHHLSVTKVIALIVNVLIVWFFAARYVRKRAAQRVRASPQPRSSATTSEHAVHSASAAAEEQAE